MVSTTILERAMSDKTTEEGVYGQVDEKVLESVARIQHNIQQATFEIGALEVRKAQILASLDSLNKQVGNLLRQEGVRLNIPPQSRWFVDDKGQAKSAE